MTIALRAGAAASPEPDSKSVPARLADVVPGDPVEFPELDAWCRRVVPGSGFGRLDTRDAELALGAAADLRGLLLPTPLAGACHCWRRSKVGATIRGGRRRWGRSRTRCASAR